MMRHRCVEPVSEPICAVRAPNRGAARRCPGGAGGFETGSLSGAREAPPLGGQRAIALGRGGAEPEHERKEDLDNISSSLIWLF